jgi:hypothetical protein
MTSETQQPPITQAVYGSSDIALILKIQESTLRKYSLLLEKNGYEFLKNENGHRAYFDEDIIVLKKMMELKSGSDMTLEQACISVVAWKKETVIAPRDTEENRHVVRYNELFEEFKSFKEQQLQYNDQMMELNKELLMQLKRQEAYIKNSIEDRDQKLMLAVRETIETKQRLAASEQEKKQWWKFWK